MYAASVRAGTVAKRAIWSTILVSALAMIAALALSLFLAERIVRPIHRVMAATRKISSGDYAVQVPEETRDELGRLAGEFNQMAAQLGRYHEMNIEQIITEKNKAEAILSSIEDGLVVFDIEQRPSISDGLPRSFHCSRRRTGEIDTFQLTGKITVIIVKTCPVALIAGLTDALLKC